MNEKELKISAEKARIAYKNADVKGKKMLECLFGMEIFAMDDIRERIKTFEDAITVLGTDNQTVIDYFKLADADIADDILAFACLRVITEALNEGWYPQYNGEESYYVWISVFSKSEYDDLSEEEKKDYYNVNINNNDVYVFVTYTSTLAIVHRSLRLALKTKELAKYCGKQFFYYWEKYLFA